MRRPAAFPAAFSVPWLVRRDSICPMPAVTFRSRFTDTRMPSPASISAASANDPSSAVDFAMRLRTAGVKPSEIPNSISIGYSPRRDFVLTFAGSVLRCQ